MSALALPRFKPGKVAAIVLLLAGCRGQGDRAAPPSASASAAGPAASPAASAGAAPAASAEAARRAWAPRLDGEADFLNYSKEVGDERFTKFVVDLKTSAIYYVDAGVYRMHKDFIFAELLKAPKTKEAVIEFDKNYGKDKPQFVMCYLVHHLGPDIWSLALWDGDKATAEHVRLAHRRMKETFYLGERVKFRPNSNHQEAVAALTGLPTVTNDQLYKASGYQPFHKGSAVGKLRVVPAGVDFDALAFSPDEIVILPEPLPDITPVAGILLQGFSTPLSHVNLRAGAWGIPNVAARDVVRKYGALAGKTVYFEAGDTSFSLREATPAEKAAASARRAESGKVKVPKANLDATALAPLDGLRASDASAYGAKTANLGEIVSGKLAGFAVPPGFGVPIAHYARHLRAAGADADVEAMLADPKFRAGAGERKAALAALRKKIVDAPLDRAFAESLGKALEGLTRPGEGGGAPPGVFVRSSTNAEDLPGFSGAGLYDTVPNVKGAEAVGAAVKKVWASVWNFAAFEERELYRVDHRKVYGAVLVQVGVDATAAGVLVTAHPTDPGEKNTYTINAKNGLGMRVVEGKKVPEIILYNVSNKGLRVISRSDEETMLSFDPAGGVREVPSPKGTPVLTTERVVRLGEAARKISGLFPRDRPLDIEWVMREKELFIVQARPYVEKAAPREPP